MSITSLCSQAYGAKNYKLVAAYFQISLVAISVISFVLVPLIIFTTPPVLRMFEIDSGVVSLAQDFIFIYAFRFIPVVMFQATRSYLNAQRCTQPALYVTIFTTSLNVLLNYIFIYGFPSLGKEWAGMGFRGSPLASLVTSMMQMTCLFLYIYFMQTRRTLHWIPWSMNTFKMKRIKRYLVMVWGVFGGLAADSWVMTAVSLMAGVLGTTAVATQGIVYNYWSILWAIYFGFGLATQTRTSFHLGRNNAEEAQRAVQVGIGLSFVFPLVSMTVYVFACNMFLGFFTADDGVRDLAHSLRFFMAAAFIMSSVSQTLLLVLDACARPTLSAGIAFLSSICVQLPLSYVLGFHYSMGLHGLWIGTLACEGLRMFAAAFIVASLNLQHEAIEAVARSEQPVVIHIADDSTVNSPIGSRPNTPAPVSPSNITVNTTPRSTPKKQQRFIPVQNNTLDGSGFVVGSGGGGNANALHPNRSSHPFLTSLSETSLDSHTN
eukprot:PhF_6_TR6206/c0_g1_i1/m.9338/K03327/TC.MATE, SLC47A, norM, mdtK, dinF; multidrug resistance protein, MATE family